MKKFRIRIVTIIMSMVMLVGNSFCVLAAEHGTTGNLTDERNEGMISFSSSGIEPAAVDSQYSSDPIGQGESGDFYVYMSSYIGFYRTITLTADRLSFPEGGQNTGYVKVTLYNPDGTVRDSWNLTPSGGYARQQYFLPSSGAWRVHIENNSNVIVYVKGQWT